MAIQILPGASNLSVINDNLLLKPPIKNNKCSCEWACHLAAPILVGLLGLALVIMGIIMANPIVGVLATLIVGFSFLLGYMAVRRMSVEQLLRQAKISLKLSQENEQKMEHNLLAMNEVNTELQTINVNLQITEKSLKEELNVLKTTNQNLQQTKKDLHLNVDRLEERNNDLEEKIVKLKEINETLNTTTSSLKAHVLDLESTCLNMKSTEENLKEINNQLKEKITSLHNELNTLHAIHQSFESGFNSQMHSFEGLNFSLQSIEQLLSKDEKEIRQRGAELNNLVKSLTFIDTSLSSSSKTFTNQQQSLKEAINSLQSFLKMIEQWCSDSVRSTEREMCNMLKQQKDDLQKELLILRKENLSLNNSSSELKGCIQVQTRLLIKNEEQIERLTLLLTHFEKLQSSLTSRTESSIGHNKEILEILCSLRESFEEYKSKKLQESLV
ncbi:hypothetical protein CLAVI_000973 [Candidatus Clavichlamydia salmonicola]|uniref:hypothetical protein n=1 Tax=Candidatus Clavichlamydia salmonicola TaxID=469812 RepID=UPI0018916014|nr:hypothetical protein [Candidatus Clavichlamydia salmonicola]MBF5051332.1 hypothetical protein [Candidatus Clavichlamydia salmonicola]